MTRKPLSIEHFPFIHCPVQLRLQRKALKHGALRQPIEMNGLPMIQNVQKSNATFFFLMQLIAAH